MCKENKVMQSSCTSAWIHLGGMSWWEEMEIQKYECKQADQSSKQRTVSHGKRWWRQVRGQKTHQGKEKKLEKHNWLARYRNKTKPVRKNDQGVEKKRQKKSRLQRVCKKKNQRDHISVKNSQTPILPSSMSIGSGLAGLVSGFGSISPGLSFRGSSAVSSSLSLWAALSLKTHCMYVTTGALFSPRLTITIP